MLKYEKIDQGIGIMELSSHGMTLIDFKGNSSILHIKVHLQVLRSTNAYVEKVVWSLLLHVIW